MTPRCKDCGAEIVSGEVVESKLHVGERSVIEVRCQLCAEAYAWALWPEELYGPFRPRLTAHRPGRA